MTDLDAILARQDGLIRQDQLGDAGVTRAAARWRLDTGRWRALLPAVFLTVTGEPTARQRLVAACLYAGPQAQLTGVAALRLHGLRELPEESWIRVLVPHARQVASVEFVRVHRTRRLDRNARALDTGGGWPGLGEVCAVPRALADAARWCSEPDPVHAMVTEAVHRRLATVTQLREELNHGPRAGGALLRRALDDLTEGPSATQWSALHGVLAGSAVLPIILWQPHLVGLRDRQPLPQPGGWIDEVGIALEVDAREYGIGRDEWEETIRRHNRWARYGVLVLYFSPKRIRRDPVAVRREIEHAYLERLRAGATAAVEAFS